MSVLNEIEQQEFSQTIDEVSATIKFLNFKPKKIILCPREIVIKAPNNEEHIFKLSGSIDSSSSTWWYDGPNTNFLLTKAIEDEQWGSFFLGQAQEFEIAKRDILRSKFQREHPHMDFSGAEIS